MTKETKNSVGEKESLLVLSQNSELAKNIEGIRALVESNSERIKALGSWPAYMDAGSLVTRVPSDEKTTAPGFDAGIACALNLIPSDKQRLSAILHGAYTPEAVGQVRREVKDLQYGSETFYWLLACSICEEGGINAEAFFAQIEKFKMLLENPSLAIAAVVSEYSKMISTFGVDPELGENVPYGEIDGCMQGAYIAGHPFAVLYNENFGIFFIGTYEETLGLESFDWSLEKDEAGRAKSGPVFSSRQFVKCKDKEELKRALEFVKANFALDL